MDAVFQGVRDIYTAIANNNAHIYWPISSWEMLAFTYWFQTQGSAMG